MSPSTDRARVVVIGSGIGGVAVAHALTVRHGCRNVVVVDLRPPLTSASDKSMECYRTWVADAAMRPLMRRSVALMEQLAASSGDQLGIHQSGYLMVTADPTRLAAMIEDAHRVSATGAGPVRTHPGDGAYPRVTTPGPHPDLTGVDVLHRTALRQHFPYLPDSAVGALHLRHGGWLSAHQLGAVMIDEMKRHGAEIVVDQVAEVALTQGAVSGVRLASGRHLATDVVVNAAGAAADRIAATAGVDLGLTVTPQVKVSFRDHRRVFPRNSPVLVNADTQELDWDDSERDALAAERRQDLLGTLPPFCHGRAEGGVDSPYVLGSWPMTAPAEADPPPDAAMPPDDPTTDPLVAEVVLRGLESLVPELRRYRTGLPASVVDGALCAGTSDGRPLAGPTTVTGLHVVAGLGGVGIMAGMALGELAALHITRSHLPSYAESFRPHREP